MSSRRVAVATSPYPSRHRTPSYRSAAADPAPPTTLTHPAPQQEAAAHAKKVAQRDKQWAVGAKDTSKTEAASANADDKARAAAEKKALIEKESGGSSGPTKK